MITVTLPSDTHSVDRLPIRWLPFLSLPELLTVAVIDCWITTEAD